MAEKYEKAATPNVVPASFTPTPEKFVPQISQELRSQQSRWAQGYALQRIEFLENQLKTSHFKREVYRLDNGYSAAEAEELLRSDIQAAKTARTVMMDHISEWAGPYGEDHFKSVVLPEIWADFVKQVRGEPAPEKAEEPEVTEEVTEEALAPEEPEEQTLPSARYDDLASMPKSEVVPPPEVTLGDVLAKIEKDNSEN